MLQAQYTCYYIIYCYLRVQQQSVYGYYTVAQKKQTMHDSVMETKDLRINIMHWRTLQLLCRTHESVI